jgi:hypothetical protein
MKLVFLLLLALFGEGSAPRPPAVHVTFSPITKAGYERAKKLARVTGETGTREKPTFPVKKQKHRLVIPTAAGNKVFRDKVFPENEVDDVTYEYLGFFPKLQQHFINVQYYESSELLVLEPSGNLIKLMGAPAYSPNLERMAVASRGLVYEMMPNGLQLAVRQQGKLKLVWELLPKTWEPVEIFWVTNSTIFLKQSQCKKGEAYNPERFTYAKLLVK